MVDLPAIRLPRLHPLFRPWAHLALSVTPSQLLKYRNLCLLSIGYAFRPRLRSRLTQSGRTYLPRADEPSSGNLGFSVRGILTHVPLLTPAFSLPCSPHLLPVMLLRTWNAPLPSLGIHSFGSMLSPGILSAQSHSTSELLRTL